MKINSKLLAFSAAIFFSHLSFATQQNADASPTTTDKAIKCLGINACRNQSACRTAANACKGQNICKGKGWLMVDNQKECLDKGGTVVEHSD